MDDDQAAERLKGKKGVVLSEEVSFRMNVRTSKVQ